MILKNKNIKANHKYSGIHSKKRLKNFWNMSIRWIREQQKSGSVCSRSFQFDADITESIACYFLIDKYSNIKFTRDKSKNQDKRKKGDKPISYDIIQFQEDTQVLWEIKSSFSKDDFTPNSFSPYHGSEKYLFLEGEMDGKYPTGIIDIYYFTHDVLPNIICNKEKNETFAKQQEDQRRPRFSIRKELINKGKTKCLGQIDIRSWWE